MARSMNRNMTRWIVALVALALPLLAVDAEARRKARKIHPIYVTADGFDAAECGAGSTPCRSISQGISRAKALGRWTVLVGPGLYGDLNFDGDLNDSGDERLPLDVEGVHVVSAQGAGRTVLKVADFSLQMVRVFGRGHFQGFTVQGGRSVGLHVFGGGSAANVVTTGNRTGAFVGRDGFAGGVIAVRNSLYGIEVERGQVVESYAIANRASGFRAVAPGSIVQGCQAIRNAGYGFELPPDAAEGSFSGNLALANRGSGFFARSGSRATFLTGNLASGNDSSGFHLSGNNHVLQNNVATANLGPGVRTTGDGVRIDRQRSIGNYRGGLEVGAGSTRVSRSALFGNAPCQVRNGTATNLFPERVYLGAAARCRGFFPSTPLAASEHEALGIKKAKKKKKNRKRKKKLKQRAIWPVQP